MRSVGVGTNVPAGGSTALAPLLRLGRAQHRPAAFVPPDVAAVWFGFSRLFVCWAPHTHLPIQILSTYPCRAQVSRLLPDCDGLCCLTNTALQCLLSFEYVGKVGGRYDDLPWVPVPGFVPALLCCGSTSHMVGVPLAKLTAWR